MKSFNPLKLFQQLRNLVSEEDSSFIELKYNLNGRNLSIFDYRLASYSDFLKDGAIESRGIMFETDDNGNFLSLLALPMPKFFNYLENPSTIGIDDHTISQCLTKEDGSLISHFMLDNEILFKSKGSVSSIQAVQSNEYMSRNTYIEGVLKELSQDRFTANLEYTSPENRIVLFYPEEQLVLLNARNMDTGEFMPYDDLLKRVQGTDFKVVKSHEQYHGMPVSDFYNEVKNLDGIEGFVIHVEKNGVSTPMKIKTDPYKEKHKIKDSINMRNAAGKETVFKLTLLGVIDDVKTNLISDFPKSEMDLVEDFENKTVQFFNHEISNAEKFLSMRILDKREYAIAAKSFNFNSTTFGVLMSVHRNIENINFNDFASNLKQQLIKNAKKVATTIK